MLHFLVDIGDVCNAKLGSPYRKCRALFAEARADCAALLGEFDFLCDMVDGFLPLCSVARGAFTDFLFFRAGYPIRSEETNGALTLSAAELFCTIPSYIAAHLRKRLAARECLTTG